MSTNIYLLLTFHVRGVLWVGCDSIPCVFSHGDPAEGADSMWNMSTPMAAAERMSKRPGQHTISFECSAWMWCMSHLLKSIIQSKSHGHIQHYWGWGMSAPVTGGQGQGGMILLQDRMKEWSQTSTTTKAH